MTSSGSLCLSKMTMGRTPRCRSEWVQGAHSHGAPVGTHREEGGNGVMDDQLNVPLEDAELLAEVELTTNLIIAASESKTTLSQADIDRLLGVEPPREAGQTIPLQKSRTPEA